MKHTISIFLILFVFSVHIAAHDYPIEVINGKRVYVYTVQKSEGLWRISKNFDVTQDEIIALNPELATSGLRYGQTIYIPAKDDTTQSEGTIEYVVQRRETLYSLAKRYGVKVDDIIAVNPQLKKSKLRAGDVILIPSGERDEPKEEKEIKEENEDKSGVKEQTAESEIVKPTDQRIHIISKGETLFSLGRQYGVSVEELQAANPVVSQNMPIGAELIIPSKDTSATNGTKKETIQEDIAKDNISQEQSKKKQEPDTISKPSLVSKTNIESLIGSLFNPFGFDSITAPPQNEPAIDSSMLATPLRIAIILPFCTDAAIDASNERFVEFYQGVLLAIKQAQDAGQTFELYVYDSEKSDVRIEHILQRPEMFNIDAIIGPAYPSQVAKAAKFAKENKVPLIVPFTSKVADVESNEYIVQFNPTDELTQTAVVNYLTERGQSINCVFVNTPYTDSDDNAKIKKMLKDKKVNITEISASIIENDSLSYLLDATRENILIFDFEQYNALQQYHKKIKTAAKKCRITLFAHHSWINQETFTLPAIYTNIFNINKFSVSRYDSRYLYYFKNNARTTDPRYDLLGYDITTYTIRLLQQGSETSLKQRAVQTQFEGVQSRIECKPTTNGGCINSYIPILNKN